MRRSMAAWCQIAQALSVLAAGCSYKVLIWERNIWQDTRGIFTLVEPQDMELYREFLPEQFEVPDDPMVAVYYADFVDTEPWPMTATEFLFPYQEAATFLRSVYQGEVGWYCLVMPVSTQAAMIGGHRLGFPKYVAEEMTLEAIDDGWLGLVSHEGTERLVLRFSRSSVFEGADFHPLQREFVEGRGVADLREQLHLMIPPGKGPEVKVINTQPPALAEREAGMVGITLREGYHGLVPPGTVAPALYQRFTLEKTGPPWILVAFVVVVLIAGGWWLIHRIKRP